MFRPNMDISDSVDSSYHHEQTFEVVPSSSVKTAKQNQTKRGGRGGPPMSARQNKKQRKGRSNANNRERTVTTLTEDPNTPYLVPTSSEEPAGGHVIASHFTGTSGSKLHNVPTGQQQPYQLSTTFGGFGYTGGFSAALSNMQPQQTFYPSQTQQQQHGNQDPPLPPGQKDLALLQHIKKAIIENQDPFFRAVPQPAALAKLYKGPLPPILQSQEQHSEESALGLPTDSGDGVTASPSASPSFTSSQVSGSQAKDIKTVPSPSIPNNRYNNSTGSNVTSTLSLSTIKTTSDPQPTSPDLHSADLAPHSGGRYEHPSGSHAQIPDSGPTGNRTGVVKSEPLDDPGTRVLHDVTDDLSRPESWAHTTSIPVKRSRSDSGRSAASRGPPSHVDNGPPDVATSPGVRDADSRTWSWQERDRRQIQERPQEPKRQHPVRSVSVQRPLDEQPSVRRGADEPSVLVEAKGAPDALRPVAASDRPHVADAPPVDSKRLVDYRLHPDLRVPLPPRPVVGETFKASAVRPTEASSSKFSSSSGFISSEALAQDRAPPTRQSTGDTTAASSDPIARSNSRLSPHQVQKKKFQKNQAGPPHTTGTGNNGAPHTGPATEHLPPPPRSAFGRPPSPPSGPPPTSARSFRQRSPSVDERRGRQPSPGGSRYRPPPNRDTSRERPSFYRPDYGSEGPIRYEEGRPYGRDYLPSPGSGERGSSAYIPAGRRDWSYGSYPPNWSPSDEPPYLKSGWEGRPPPPGERDRYGYPRSAGWSERDYPGRDSYPPGPPTSADDRYSGGRPAVYPTYSRVRPRSPSPIRRQAPDLLDDRPPVKRSREEFPLVDYYPPLSAGGGRRGVPAGDYPPPRSGSPGPGTGSSWPPPSSTSSGGPPAAGPPDRDYRMGSYPPPSSGGYDRPRSPGLPGRPYARGGGSYTRDSGRGTYPRP